MPDQDSVMSDRTVRAIHVALALYLVPVLLAVLAVGGIGIVIVGIARTMTGMRRGSFG